MTEHAMDPLEVIILGKPLSPEALEDLAITLGNVLPVEEFVEIRYEGKSK